MCPFHNAASNVLPVHANHMATLEEIRLQFLFAIFYFGTQVLPDCQLMKSRWQAWSAGNHLQSADLECVPSTRQPESSYLDPSLRLDVPAYCGTASCFQPQLAPSWFHLERAKFLAPSVVSSLALLFSRQGACAQTGHTTRASSMGCSCPINIVGNGIRLRMAKSGNHVSLFFSWSGRKKWQKTSSIQHEF